MAKSCDWIVAVSAASIVNALCVDVDDFFGSFHEAGISPRRYQYSAHAETGRLLLELEELKIKATFFVPGLVLQATPGLVREILECGHDIASHGFTHRAVSTMSAEEFRSDVTRSKRMLEDISGVEIDTYKAPIWSLHSPANYDVLLEAGYRIDHSAMPGVKRRLGVAATRLEPVRYRDNLTIIPPTVAKIGSIAVPLCGGFYNAYVPWSWQRKFYDGLNTRGLPFNYYFHPFEHSPSVSRIDILRKGTLGMALYAAHIGTYRANLRRMVQHYALGPLKLSYRGLLHRGSA